MFGRNFTGRGQRGGMGFGFRGNSPPWPYIGRGRGGLPRCSFYPGSLPNTLSTAAGTGRDQQLGFLRSQAESMKKDLGTVESRIRDLEDKK